MDPRTPVQIGTGLLSNASDHMARICRACRGRCIQLKKFDIIRNDGVWVVETQVYPCSQCNGLGVDINAVRTKKKRRRRGFGTKECQLCGKEVERQHRTRHHLRPKSLNRHKSVIIAMLCKDCHTKVHDQFTNEELDQKYNTIDKLKAAFKKLRNGPVDQPGTRSPAF